MRLLNVNTFCLEEFFGTPSPPKYAIVSHTWGDEEVSFEDISKQRRVFEQRGFHKIKSACDTARTVGIGYVWIDTCCINKDSSVELTEAINSMYRWYQDAEVCYAFLEDLPPAEALTESGLRLSRWFTRGWTLQELIAPATVEFYDGGWKLCGKKSTEPLLTMISRITHIDREVLLDNGLIPGVSVARKMSWASDRVTARVEDIAYCLLGLFDVNMPILYGEGPKAFLRLQQEILQTSTDMSLFAWGATGNEKYRGVLASSPAEFRMYRDFDFGRSALGYYAESVLTNRGVRVTAELLGCRSGPEYVMDLGYIAHAGHLINRVGILLLETTGCFVRATPQRIVILAGNPKMESKTIFLLPSIHPKSTLFLSIEHVTSRTKYSPTSYANYGYISRCGIQRDIPQPFICVGDCKLSQLPIQYKLSLSQERTPDGWNGQPIYYAFATGSTLMVLQPFFLISRDGEEVEAPHSRSPEWNRQEGGQCAWGKHCTSDYPATWNFPAAVDTKDVDLELSETMSGDAFQTRSLQDWSESGSVLAEDHQFHQFRDDLVKAAENRFQEWVLEEIDYHGRIKEVSPTISRERNTLSPPKKRARQRSIGDECSVTYAFSIVSDTEGECPVLLACPFYVKDKLRNMDCLKCELRQIQHVKQHLLQKHMQPYYCPTCGQTFTRTTLRDDHIVGRSCRQQHIGRFDGVSHEQKVSLQARTDSKLSKDDQWFEIWRVVFVGEPYPSSPYIDRATIISTSKLRKFWHSHGQEVVGTFLKSRGSLPWDLRQEERALGGIKSLVFSDLLRRQLAHAS